MSTTPPNTQLRERRRQIGLSQAEAAMLLGVSRATYQNWERGSHEPQPAHRLLLDAFIEDGVKGVKRARHLPKTKQEAARG